MARLTDRAEASRNSCLSWNNNPNSSLLCCTDKPLLGKLAVSLKTMPSNSLLMNCNIVLFSQIITLYNYSLTSD